MKTGFGISNEMSSSVNVVVTPMKYVIVSLRGLTNYVIAVVSLL